MREKLRDIEGKRATFTATFSRYGQRSSGRYVTLTALFLDVRGTAGEEITDHVWLRRGKGINALGLLPGDRISFTATSRPYWSGYIMKHRNFGLKYPRDFRRLVPASASGQAFTDQFAIFSKLPEPADSTPKES